MRFLAGLVIGIIIGAVMKDQFFPEGFLVWIDNTANLIRDSVTFW
ncbi:MAG TPA: hypothetical protein VG672_13340 [Bryobacteraceae bacterium]|nr:hypothetical protein [Bryobacteraceae bacterium]